MSGRRVWRMFSRSLCRLMATMITASGTHPRATPPDAPEPGADVHYPRRSLSGICWEGGVRWFCPCYSSVIIHNAHSHPRSHRWSR
jgi:hypothetical protein